MKKILVVVALCLAPSFAAAATPSEGEPLKVRRGFFTETDVGAFMTFGGDDVYSNLQSYLQLGLGYDFHITQSFGLGVGLHVGVGASAANCYSGRDPRSLNCPQSENFTVFLIDASFTALIRAAERFYVTPKLVGGFTLLDPPPVVVDGNPVNMGGNAGIGIGVEYATNMDHFSIGLDVVARVVIPTYIIALQIFPRVKYTF